MKCEYSYWFPSGLTTYEFNTISEDWEESFNEAGFVNKTEYLRPYFYAIHHDESQFLELTSRERKNGESIVDLWDNHGELFSFFCHNKLETYECCKSLLEYAKNRIEIECKLKRFVEESRKECDFA